MYDLSFTFFCIPSISIHVRIENRLIEILHKQDYKILYFICKASKWQIIAFFFPSTTPKKNKRLLSFILAINLFVMFISKLKSTCKSYKFTAYIKRPLK